MTRAALAKYCQHVEKRPASSGPPLATRPSPDNHTHSSGQPLQHVDPSGPPLQRTRITATIRTAGSRSMHAHSLAFVNFLVRSVVRARGVWGGCGLGGCGRDRGGAGGIGGSKKACCDSFAQSVWEAPLALGKTLWMPFATSGALRMAKRDRMSTPAEGGTQTIKNWPHVLICIDPTKSALFGGRSPSTRLPSSPPCYVLPARPFRDGSLAHLALLDFARCR